MDLFLIMCRSLTHAQRSLRLLEHNGIVAAVVKAPQELRSNGCGYALRLYRHFEDAVRVLRTGGLLQGKLYRQTADGQFEEAV